MPPHRAARRAREPDGHRDGDAHHRRRGRNNAHRTLRQRVVEGEQSDRTADAGAGPPPPVGERRDRITEHGQDDEQ